MTRIYSLRSNLLRFCFLTKTFLIFFKLCIFHNSSRGHIWVATRWWIFTYTMDDFVMGENSGKGIDSRLLNCDWKKGNSLFTYVLLLCLSRFLDKVVRLVFLGALMASREIHPMLHYSILKWSQWGKLTCVLSYLL